MQLFAIEKIKIKLDLKAFYKKMSEAVIEAMQSAIEHKQNINGKRIKPNTASTKKRKGFTHRMKETGKFIENAHKYKVKKFGAKIYVSKSIHSSKKTKKGKVHKVTYEEIAKYNQPKDAGVPGIDAHGNSSEHFGLSNEFQEIHRTELEKEVLKQLKEKAIVKKRFKVAL